MKGVIVILIGGGLILACSLFTIDFLAYGLTDLPIQTNSPNQSYSVTIEPRPTDGLPFSDQEVVFSLSRENSPKRSVGTLLALDWPSKGFVSRYPSHSWVSENTLEFKNHSSKEEQLDLVSVSNHSNKKIDFLVVGALDLFLIFDLAPNSKIELKVPRYKWQSWITVHGKFINGEPIPETGVNFSHRDKENHLKYCVDIKEWSAEITSSTVGGWTFEKPRIPPSPQC